MKPMFVDELRTTRLLLTRVQENNRGDFLVMYGDSRVMVTMGGVRSEVQTNELMQIDLTHWERHGFGRWVAHELVTGQFAGRGGLHIV